MQLYRASKPFQMLRHDTDWEQDFVLREIEVILLIGAVYCDVQLRAKLRPQPHDVLPEKPSGKLLWESLADACQENSYLFMPAAIEALRDGPVSHPVILYRTIRLDTGSAKHANTYVFACPSPTGISEQHTVSA